MQQDCWLYVIQVARQVQEQEEKQCASVDVREECRSFNRQDCVPCESQCGACRPGYQEVAGHPACANVDDCTNHACANGATCVDELLGYRCVCAPGYNGTFCTQNIDDCASQPCKNGATCVDGVNNFACQCAPGWEGPTCSVDKSDCAPNPCHHGGTCTDRLNGVTCACPIGWTGPTCAIDVSMCASTPCLNGATCVDGVGANFTCICAPGWSGPRCDNDPDDCASRPCQNGATCVDRVGNFTCVCRPGWACARCECDMDDCASQPCANGATCRDTGANSFACDCVAGFQGVLCAEDVNDCASRPCRNGGVCQDMGTNAFACNCSGTGFTGVLCNVPEIELCDENAKARCENLNRETCTEGVNSAECGGCLPGFVVSGVAGDPRCLFDCGPGLSTCCRPADQWRCELQHREPCQLGQALACGDCSTGFQQAPNGSCVVEGSVGGGVGGGGGGGAGEINTSRAANMCSIQSDECWWVWLLLALFAAALLFGLWYGWSRLRGGARHERRIVVQPPSPLEKVSTDPKEKHQLRKAGSELEVESPVSRDTVISANFKNEDVNGHAFTLEGEENDAEEDRTQADFRLPKFPASSSNNSHFSLLSRVAKHSLSSSMSVEDVRKEAASISQQL
eukprot:g74468.t1